MIKLLIILILGVTVSFASSKGIYTEKQFFNIKNCLKHIKINKTPRLKKYLLGMKVGSYSENKINNAFYNSCKLGEKPLFLENNIIIVAQSNSKKRLKNIQKKVRLSSFNILNKKELKGIKEKNYKYAYIAQSLEDKLKKDGEYRFKHLYIGSHKDQMHVNKSINYLKRINPKNLYKTSKYILFVDIGLFTSDDKINKLYFLSALKGYITKYTNNNIIIVAQSNSKKTLKKLQSKLMLRYSLKTYLTKNTKKIGHKKLNYGTIITYLKSTKKYKYIKKKRILKTKKLKKKNITSKIKVQKPKEVKFNKPIKSSKNDSNIDTASIEKELDELINEAKDVKSSLKKAKKLNFY